ncbi:hypothetical protein ACFLUS_06020 [Chloroflexota bacterium]
MPKGYAVPNAVKSKIYEFLLIDENLSGKELKNAIEEDAEKNKNLQEVILTERKYQQLKQDILPEIKKMKAGPLEQPWSVMSLPLFPIDGQALPIVLSIWKMQLEAYFEIRETEPDANPPILSVRQALWISRLSSTVKCSTQKELQHMRDTAYQFALLEKILILRKGYISSTYTLFETWGLTDLSLMPSLIVSAGLVNERKKFKKKDPNVAAEYFSDEYRNERTNY